MWNDSPYVWRELPGEDGERTEDGDDAHDDEFVIVEGRATTYRDYKR